MVAFILVSTYHASWKVLHGDSHAWQSALSLNLQSFRDTSASFTKQQRPLPAAERETKPQLKRVKRKEAPSRFAYAFVTSGVDPDERRTYQNYLFNIAITAWILHDRGSKAHVVALFQIAPDHDEIPPEDLQLLHYLGVHVYYFPPHKDGKGSFYRSQMEKFRILGLTQYDRVIYLDGDIIPLANLDFLFELSMDGALKEDVLLKTLSEPSHGGFFMLKPGTLEVVQSIMEERERKAKTLPSPYFDVVDGWGHVMVEEEKWILPKWQDTNWTFYAAFADQGLLYHYTRFVRKSVSVIAISKNVVEQYEENEQGIVPLVEEIPNREFFGQVDANIIEELTPNLGERNTPKSWMKHFTGTKKPWMAGGPPSNCCFNRTLCCSQNESRYDSHTHYWFWVLAQIMKELELDHIDFSQHWNQNHSHEHAPKHGLKPKKSDVLIADSNILTPLQRIYPEGEL